MVALKSAGVSVTGSLPRGSAGQSIGGPACADMAAPRATAAVSAAAGNRAGALQRAAGDRLGLVLAAGGGDRGAAAHQRGQAGGGEDALGPARHVEASDR